MQYAFGAGVGHCWQIGQNCQIRRNWEINQRNSKSFAAEFAELAEPSDLTTDQYRIYVISFLAAPCGGPDLCE
jgi:hypothetical protein